MVRLILVKPSILILKRYLGIYSRWCLCKCDRLQSLHVLIEIWHLFQMYCEIGTWYLTHTALLLIHTAPRQLRVLYISYRVNLVHVDL